MNGTNRGSSVHPFLTSPLLRAASLADRELGATRLGERDKAAQRGCMKPVVASGHPTAQSKYPPRGRTIRIIAPLALAARLP
jgi:hypothetical protein